MKQALNSMRNVHLYGISYSENSFQKYSSRGKFNPYLNQRELSACDSLSLLENNSLLTRSLPFTNILYYFTIRNSYVKPNSSKNHSKNQDSSSSSLFIRRIITFSSPPSKMQYIEKYIQSIIRIIVVRLPYILENPSKISR